MGSPGTLRPDADERTQQKHEIQRRADGHYVVQHMGTWLVLKLELPETYVSPGA